MSSGMGGNCTDMAITTPVLLWLLTNKTELIISQRCTNDTP